MQHPEVLTLLPQTGEKPLSGVLSLPMGRAHLIGIAGSGLRSLAEVLLGWGWELSGSDLATETLGQLATRGVRVYRGHAGEQVPPEADLVIASDAIGPENPELAEARRRGVPVLSYFQALGQLMAGRQGVAVAGTHGKSTTTAMLAHLLIAAGRDPTVICGAAPLGQENGGRPGRSSLMVVEACEYRANFLHLCPQQAAILGIEPDHFDCYPTLERLAEAFTRFAERIPQDGLLVARHECAVTRQVAAHACSRVETFGLDDRADWSARGLTEEAGKYGFALFRHQRRLDRVCLHVPGRHNVLNALAAAALAWDLGLTAAEIAAGLASFAGLHRRLETRGQWRGATWLDDYAHHPTEIAATLATVRQMHPGRQVWCVFQPHQASRTEHLLDELAVSLQNADKLVVADIFRAREPAPRPGEVTAADLAERARRLGSEVADVHAIPAIQACLEAQIRPGDVVITMGAGDIGRIYQNRR